MMQKINVTNRFSSSFLLVQALFFSLSTHAGIKELTELIAGFKSSQSLNELKDNQKFSLKLPSNESENCLEVVVPIKNLTVSDHLEFYLRHQTIFDQTPIYEFDNNVPEEAFLLVAGYCAASDDNEREKIENKIGLSKHKHDVYEVAVELQIKELLYYFIEKHNLYVPEYALLSKEHYEEEYNDDEDNFDLSDDDFTNSPVVEKLLSQNKMKKLRSKKNEGLDPFVPFNEKKN